MNDEIYVSIKPSSIFKIKQGTKNHEFRNYVPKENFRVLFVYVSAPQSELKYVIEIGEVVKHPQKLKEDGDGNLEFNEGKKSKYAYKIIKVYELLSPISLKELKERFNFIPPQRFSYSKTFSTLTKHIKETEKMVIICE